MTRRRLAGWPARLRLTIYVLQVVLCADVTHGLLQRAIVDGLLFGLGEEVRHDAVEELQVVLEELWDIDIQDGPQADQLLEGEKKIVKVQGSVGFIKSTFLFLNLYHQQISHLIHVWILSLQVAGG